MIKARQDDSSCLTYHNLTEGHDAGKKSKRRDEEKDYKVRVCKYRALVKCN